MSRKAILCLLAAILIPLDAIPLLSSAQAAQPHEVQNGAQHEPQWQEAPADGHTAAVLNQRNNRNAKTMNRREGSGKSLGWLNGLWQAVIWCSVLCLVLTCSQTVSAAPPRRPKPGGATSTVQEPRATVHEPGQVVRASQEQTGVKENGAGELKGTRPYLGSPHIVVAPPEEFPRIRAFDNHNPGSIAYNMRPNLFNQPVPDEWDFYNLINTDRPDFTDADYSVGKGVTIIETGYTYRQIHDGDTRFSHRDLPESLIRYGLTDEFELRMKWFGYVMQDQTNAETPARDQVFGTDDLQLGFKWEMAQQNDWIPMFTLVSAIVVPTGTHEITSRGVLPNVNLVYGWGVRRWLYLKMSTGWDYQKAASRSLEDDGMGGAFYTTRRDSFNLYHQSASLVFQATKRVGGFVEWYTLYNTHSEDTRAVHFADTGLSIYATPNVQFDVRVGRRLSERVHETFTGAGLSLRF